MSLKGHCKTHLHSLKDAAAPVYDSPRPQTSQRLTGELGNSPVRVHMSKAIMRPDTGNDSLLIVIVLTLESPIQLLRGSKSFLMSIYKFKVCFLHSFQSSPSL